MHIADKNLIYYDEILNNYLYVPVVCFVLCNGIFVHTNGTAVWSLKRKNVEVSDSDVWSFFKHPGAKTKLLVNELLACSLQVQHPRVTPVLFLTLYFPSHWQFKWAEQLRQLSQRPTRTTNSYPTAHQIEPQNHLHLSSWGKCQQAIKLRTGGVLGHISNNQRHSVIFWRSFGKVWDSAFRWNPIL